MTAYKLRQIGRALKTGRAAIVGQCSGGARWPDHPHYWIVQDYYNQRIEQVLVSVRPSWAKYMEAQ